MDREDKHTEICRTSKTNAITYIHKAVDTVLALKHSQGRQTELTSYLDEPNDSAYLWAEGLFEALIQTADKKGD